MNIWILLGGLNALAAVALGAYGWHSLAAEPDARVIFMMGTQYHMWHALGMVAAGFAWTLAPVRAFQIAGASFQAGIVLFSGTLYAFGGFMTIPLVGAAPVGGGLFMLGWLLLAIAGAKHLKRAP